MRRGIASRLLGAVLVTASCGGGEAAFDTRTATIGTASGTAVESVVQGGLLPAAAPAAETGDAGPDQVVGPSAGPGGARVDPAPANDPIRLGTILPLQGSERDFGVPVLRATQAYIDEVNARGGLLGRRIELVAYSACLLCQGDALTAARRLVEEDGVVALVNTYVMVVAFQPVIPYLVERNIPLIQGGSFSQTSDALSPVNFATAPPGLFYARWIPVTAKRAAGITRVGIVYLDVPSETGGLEILRRELEAEGIEVVAEGSVAAAEEAVTNMDSVVTRFRTAGADGVVALDPAVLVFGRLAARRQSWDAAWVGPAAWSSLVETGCGETCDANVYTETGGLSFTDRATPQMGQYLDTMGRRYPGGEITGHTLAAWVGMQLYAEAVARAGGVGADDVVAAVESMRNLDLGTTSPLTFTPDRHLGGSATVLLTLQGGRFVRRSEPQSFGWATP